MKTRLPRRAEYYRPTRARELRAGAAWTERWLPGLLGGAWLAATAAGYALLPAALDLLAPVAAAMLVLLVLGVRLSRQILADRRAARGLEQAHRMRYGASKPEADE